MNLKNKRGITLIALVITIIVLLILAGVTIATLMGDNGVLTKANKASEENTHSTVYEGLSLEITNYYADKKLGKTTESLINYLKSNSIIDEDLVINVEELVGQTLSLGNGNTTDGDYYKLEEVIATVSTTKELEKVATTGEVKVADTSDDDSTQYKLVYCRTVNVVEWEKEIVNVEPDHPSLGKLADVVEVGDYVNYAPTYTNVSEVKEGLGNGWRVAYADSSSGVVTLVSEGVPLSVMLSNGYSSNANQINFEYEELNKMMDNTVADNIDIIDLKDIQSIGSYANYELTHIDAVDWSIDESYEFNEDRKNLINIGTEYLLNTKGSDRYGKEHYFWVSKYNLELSTADYTGDIGVRLVVDLKSDLEYYEGTGTQGDSYQIY